MATRSANKKARRPASIRVGKTKETQTPTTEKREINIMTNSIMNAATTASEKWKSCFNAGDAAGCASCYEEDAKMVATPFGEFNGREAIEAFWAKIIADGFADVKYTDIVVKQIDDNSAVLTATWKMNNASGIITNELWVLQDDGSARLREDHFEAT